MKKILIYFLFSISLTAYCQSNFYIKPVINYKFPQGYSAVDDNFFIESNGFLRHEFFDGSVKKIGKLASINIGLGFGYKIGKKNRFELNWSQDITGNTSYFRYFVYHSEIDVLSGNLTEGYRENNNTFTSFITNNRFDLRYYQSVSKNLSFNFGLGIYHTNGGLAKGELPTQYEYPGGNEALNDLGDSILINRYSTNYYNKITPFLILGLDYKINAGKTYLFTLSSFYTLGFKTIESVKHEVTIFNSTKSDSYDFYSNSRGSGLYFEISREMNLSTIALKSRNIFDKIFKRNNNKGLVF